MSYKNTKRGLSLFLAFALFFTTVSVGIGSEVVSRTAVPEKDSVSKSTVSSALTFYVPELIYLQASVSADSAKTFKYYVDCNTSGTLDTSKAKTSGTVYFYCANATNISITLSGCESYTLGASSASGTTLSTYISAGTLSTGLSQGYTSTLTWTATYTVNGENKTAKAYTVCYAPQVSVVATALRTYNNDGTGSGDRADLQGFAWISGVHGCGTGGNYHANTSGSYTLAPLLGTVSSYTDNHASVNWFFAQANGWTYYDQWASGDNRITLNFNSPTGTITVDTSRYSNINQIPNLTCGHALTHTNNMDGGKFKNYASNFSPNGQAGWTYANEATTDNGRQNSIIRDNPGYIFWGSTDDVNVTNGVQRNDNMWSQYISDYDNIRLKVGSWGNNNDEYNAISMLVNVNMTKVNKGALRSKVRQYTNLGLQSTDYPSGTWATYESALLNAAARLGNPTATDASTTALDNAYSALVGNTFTATITHTATDSSFNYNDTVLTFNSGDNVTASPNTHTGYTASAGTQNWNNRRANIAYTYTYTPISSTLTFNAQSGSVSPGSKTVTYNQTYGAGTGGWPTPTRTGYTFGGWYTGTDGSGTKIESSTVVQITSAQTVYAKWTANTYAVTFNANGGTGSMTAQNIVFGQTAALSSNSFSRTGHTFAGWSTSAGGGVAYANGASYTMNTEGAALYAVWTPNNYTITFESNGGSAVSAITQAYGTAVTKPTNPTKTGYTFADWYSDSGLTQIVAWPYTMVASSPTFYAKWTANQYVVTLNPQGGSVTPGTVNVTYASTYGTLPTPAKTGYTFTGWFTGVGGTGSQVTSSTVVTITSAQTLYANWVANTYTITYDGNGATGGSTGNSSHTYDLYSNLTANGFTRTGYSFSGWNTASNGSGSSYSDGQSVLNVTATPGGIVTFYAIWSANTYEVIFNANTGSGSMNNQSIVFGQSANLTANAFGKTGHSFAGWATSAGGSVAYANGASYMMTTEGATLYAKWNLNQYTVSFDANGGSGSANAVTQDYGSSVTLPTTGFSKTGYTFIGWNTSPSATTTLSSYTVPANNATLYAIYTINQYTVSFDANGGSGSASPVTQNYGTAVTLPGSGFTKTGYTFIGWNTSAGATTALSSYTVPANNATLYAIYTVNQYTVSFDANGGSGTALPITQNYNTAVTLPTAGFSKTGYTFIGWNTNPSATTAISNFTMPAAESTLYAIYTINQYTVSFDANSGSGSASPITQNYGTTVTLPTTGFTKAGYDFLGWSENPAATTATYTSSMTMPAYDPALYAVWQASPADYSAVTAAIALAQAANLPANADNDPDYIPGGDLYEALEFTNGGWYARSMFSAASLAAMDNAINAVVYGLNSTQQATVDAYAAAIMAAYNNIELAVADYSTLDDLVDDAEAILNNPDPPYTSGSLDYLSLNLEYAYGVQAAQYKKPVQTFVNDIATMLSDAIAALEYRPADYTIVDNALLSVPDNLYENYTAESVANLVNYYTQQIDYTLTLENNGQATVNGYAAQIYALIDALVLKEADYTIVNNAIKAIPDNDGGLIAIDYDYLATIYTTVSIADLTNAIESVVYGKDISEQAIVNGYAADIIAATSALEPRAADYTYLGLALQNTPPRPSSYYTTESYSAYVDAVAAGQALYNNQNLNITQQYIIDNAVAQITGTFGNLTFKPVTYTVKYQDSLGAALLSDYVGNSTANDWVTENAPAITGYTVQQATIQKQMTGTNSENILTFVYNINSYTVTFNTNGGTAVDPITQNYNTQVQQPQDPSKAGYTFSGWYSNSGLTLPVSWPYTLGASSVTFYAKWTAHTYTVNYNGNGSTGGSTASSQHTYDVAANLTSNGYTRTGYSFLGWSENQAATAPDYSNGQSVTNLTTVSGGIVTFYAIWSINQYTVNFDANGGAGTITPITQDYNTSVSLPVIGVSRTGYTLLGWNTDAEAATPIASYTVPANNSTLYAVWEINQYTVSFDANGGTGEASPVTLDYGSPVDLPGGFTKAGYTFIGWNTTPGAATALTSYNVPAEDSTLYAVYTVNQYTVNFNANGGAGSADPVTQDYGSAVTLPATGFTKTGYTFIGWNTDSGATTALSSYTVPAQNSTLYAIYEINQYTVSFDANGGTGSASPVTLDYDTAVTLPESGFAKTGYTFIGWNTAPGATTAISSYAVPAEDSTLYAIYTINQYTVSFDANGGTGSADPVTQDYATEISLPSTGFSKIGYTFIGWNTTPGAAAALSSFSMPAEDTTLYAIYEINQYTVSFDANGGTGSAAPVTQDYGTAVTLPESGFAKTGYTFLGWNTTAGASTALASYTVPAYNATLYAVYEINQYTVTFDSNGGVGSATPVTQDYATAVTLPASGFTKTGYSFIGWNTAPGASTALESYNMPAEDTTLYAIYTINQYTISFDANGGTGSASPVTQNYATQATLPASGFTKTGYTFIGWSENPAATQAQYTGSMSVPAYDATLYAVYTINQYTISFVTYGGTAVDDITRDFNTSVSAPAEPEKPGYTFAGWFEDDDLTIAVAWPYTLGASDVTFYAKWTANTYTVTYDGNGHTGGATADSSHTFDAASNLTANGFTRTGHSFLGWSQNAGSSTAQYSDGQSVFNLTSEDEDVITFYAVWSVNQYTVTFDANGGTGSATEVTQDYGTAVTLPESGFTKTGYTFIGWNTAAGATTAIGSYTVPAYNSTLYAIYEINQYTVTFNANGGTGSAAPVTQNYGTEVTLPATGFAKTGYTFIGWNTTPGATTALSYFSMPAEDTTLYAVYEINQYTVTFDANGGVGSTTPVTQDYGTAVTLPTSGFSKTGHTFIGWNTTAGASTALSSFTMPAEDTTLYAVYTINQYTVTFDANGGTGSAAPVTQDYGTAVTLPESGFAKTGYTFIGWNTDAEAETALSAYTVPDYDATLYAIYTVNQYTVTFDANGGTGSASPVTQNYGTAVTLPASGFAKTGYTFIGWNTTADASTALTSFTMPAEDTTLYAIYTVNQYTVTFDANGGTGSANAVTQNYGTAVTLPESGFAKTGYTFLGWNTTAGASTALSSFTMPAEDTTLYAVYEINQYTITFNSNGGTAVNSISDDYGASIDEPNEPSKVGYTFAGWFSTAGLTLPVTWPHTMGAQDATFYAKWTANTYTVAYGGNGATGGSTADSSHTYDTASNLTANGYTRTGYSFLGWSQNSGAAAADYTDGQSVLNLTSADNGVVTFYAVWGVNQYTVTFDANGGTGSASPVTLDYGAAVTLPESGFAKTGHTFLGWNTTAGASTALSSFTMPAEDTTLYAIYTINQYTVTFDANGGTGSASPVTLDYGAAVTLPESGFAKTGYTFLGWNTTVGASTALSSFTMPAEDTTLYAVYTTNLYTIVFDDNGGQGGTSGQMAYGAALTPPAVTKEGYTFTGWDPEPPATVPASDATYTAQWSLNSYTITFDAAGGQGGTSASMAYGAPLTPPTVTRLGYAFAGWSPAVPATVPASNATYTAQWTSVNVYTITFNAGTLGTIDGETTQVIQLNEGSEIVVPVVKAVTGWGFAGWSPAVPLTAQQDATYTAQYVKTDVTLTKTETGFNVNVKGWEADNTYQVWTWQKVTSDIQLDVNSDVPSNQWILSSPYTLGSDATVALDGGISFDIADFVSPDENYTVAVRIVEENGQFVAEIRDTYTPAEVQICKITKILVDGMYYKNTEIKDIDLGLPVNIKVIGNFAENTTYTAKILETLEDLTVSNTNEFVWDISAMTPHKYTIEITADNGSSMDTRQIVFLLYKGTAGATYASLSSMTVTADSGTAVPRAVNIVPTFTNGYFYYRVREVGYDNVFISENYTTSGSTIAHTADKYGIYYLYGYVNRSDQVPDLTYYDDGMIKTFEVKRGTGESTASITASVNVSNPVLRNTPIVFTASSAISGIGSTPVEYSFWRYDADGYALVKDWSSSNTLDWTPARVGTYKIEVRARGEDAGSYEALDWLYVRVYDPALPTAQNVSISINAAELNANARAKTPITVRANATSTNSEDLLYKFYVYDESMQTVTLQNYSPDQECIWKPREAGNYEIRVLVKNKASYGAYDGADSFPVTVQ